VTGIGNRAFGAPALNDAIWLYSGDRATIQAQIYKPRQGVMPAWTGRLDDTVLKELAVFVYSLGGGEAAPR
jgi:cytochrome c oxidase cbb3-type subunit 3